MKKTIFAVVALLAMSVILVATYAVTAQQDDAPAPHWEVIGTDDAGYTYAVNTTNVKTAADAPFVQFYIVAYGNDDNFEVRAFAANCDTREYAVLGIAGKSDGKPYQQLFDQPEVQPRPPADSVIDAGESLICEMEFGLPA